MVKPIYRPRRSKGAIWEIPASLSCATGRVDELIRTGSRRTILDAVSLWRAAARELDLAEKHAEPPQIADVEVGRAGC